MTCPDGQTDLPDCVSCHAVRQCFASNEPQGACASKQDIEIMLAHASKKQFHGRRKCKIQHSGSVFIDAG